MEVSLPYFLQVDSDDRCFVFKRADWFRTLMIWVHLVGLLFFVASKWMDVHVVYQEVCPLPFPPRNPNNKIADP